MTKMGEQSASRQTMTGGDTTGNQEMQQTQGYLRAIVILVLVSVIVLLFLVFAGMIWVVFGVHLLLFLSLGVVGFLFLGRTGHNDRCGRTRNNQLQERLCRR